MNLVHEQIHAVGAWETLTIRTAGPLALNDRLRALTRAAASLQPGLAERLGLRPEVTAGALRNPVRLSREQSTRDTVPQFAQTIPPAKTIALLLLSGDAQT